MLWRGALRGGAVGLLLGVLFGTGEVLRLAWFVRGGQFRSDLLLEAWLIDGGLLLVVGVVLGGVWGALFGRRPARRPTQPRRQPIAASAAAPARGPSRRAVLRLAALAGAGVGVMGLVQLADAQQRSQRPRTAALVSDGGAAAAPPPDQPNVLLVTVDTLRADQLGSYGHPFVKTPALDKFASEGARFTQHLIQEPQTNPSHASMFTGMYPSSSGVRIHMVDKLPPNLDTLASLFQQAGYQTAGLYSWMSFDPQYCGFQRGFQIYEDLTLNKPGILANPLVQQAAADYRVAEQYLVVPKAASVATGLNQSVENASKGRADRTTDAAIAQLRAFGGQPFFMWLHYFDPHYPYEPPGSYANMYDANYAGRMNADIATVDAILAGKLKPKGADLQRILSLYQGEITYTDSQLARLFAALDSLNLTSRTIVALTGDHGEGFAEHVEFEQDVNYFHPHSLYNDEARVPLLLRYPGRIKAGAVVNAPTQAIDLFPTLLELAGQPVAAQAQGKSVVGLLDGTSNGADRAAYAAMPDYVFTAVATPRWKLIQNNGSGQRRLYDLSNDPGETRDVLGANDNIGGQLADQLHQWMKAVKIS